MKTPRYIEVDGFRLPPTFDPDVFRDAEKYTPKKDRVVVATYPKCGTTWVQQIVMLILRKGVPPNDASEYFSLMPFLEMTPSNVMQNLPKEAIVKTHLPFDRITFSNAAKYVYVARHPADCVVSFYHHTRYFPVYFFSDGTFDEFFELFISGNTDFGDYFDHLLSWYEHRNKPNVFFITYEALKADNKGTILEIAKFIGDEFYEYLKRDNENVLQDVIKYSSVGFMKNTVDKYFSDSFALNTISEDEQKGNPVLRNYAKLYEEASKKGHLSIGSFIRKGETGEGKIILSEDQKRRLEQRIQEKWGHSDVMKLWQNK